MASSNGCLLHKHLGLAQHQLGSASYQLTLLTRLPLACCWVNSSGLSFICLFSTCFSFFISLAQTFPSFHTYRRKDRNTQGLFMLRSLYEGGTHSSLPYSGGKTHIEGIGNIYSIFSITGTKSHVTWQRGWILGGLGRGRNAGTIRATSTKTIHTGEKELSRRNPKCQKEI